MFGFSLRNFSCVSVVPLTNAVTTNFAIYAIFHEMLDIFGLMLLSKIVRWTLKHNLTLDLVFMAP